MTFGHVCEFTFFAGDGFAFNEEIPDRVRALGAFGDPVFDALVVEVNGGRLR